MLIPGMGKKSCAPQTMANGQRHDFGEELDRPRDQSKPKYSMYPSPVCTWQMPSGN